MKRVLRYSVFIVAVAATPMAALNGSWSPAVSAPSGVGTAALPDRELPKPNYDLAARWTSAKVGKYVFSTAVTPHWLEFSDRFWYDYETPAGRRCSG